MAPALGKLLAESYQRRQIKIHCNAVDEEQGEIGWRLKRSKEEAVKPLIIGCFERAELGIEGHGENAWVFSLYMIGEELNAGRLRRNSRFNSRFRVRCIVRGKLSFGNGES